MAKKVIFSQLRTVPWQAGDTIAAYRNGKVVRIPVFGSGDLPSLAVVASTGRYSDLLGLPTLGTAASKNEAYFATADQGSKGVSAYLWGNHALAGYALASVVTAANIKLLYESNSNTNVFTDKQKADLTSVFSWGNHASAGYALATAVTAGLSSKVDKQTGYGLSQQNFTSAEKQKLAGLESSRYKGLFSSLAALQSGVTAPAAGDYADVDAGSGYDVSRYIWDSSDNKWVKQSGTVAALTAAQVKSLYESNPDTNAFSNKEKADLATAYSWGNHASVGYVLSTDARLTNSREWTAATVSQAEAEAGTATTRRAWTAQRIRQALVAWWDGSADKTKLDGIEAGANKFSLPAGANGQVLKHNGTTWAAAADANTTYAVMSEAEVTAGTSTTARALSAQRLLFAVQAHAPKYSNSTGLTLVGTVFSINEGQIPENAKLLGTTDLNTLNAVNHAGIYYQTANANATAARNYPTTRAGVLVVYKTAGVTQEYTTYKDGAGTGNVQKFVRGFYSNAWGAWREVIMDGVLYSKVEVDNLISAATSGARVWQTATTTLTKNRYHKISFSSPRQINLPASPVENDFVEIVSTAGSMKDSTILRNGKTIMGLAEDMLIDTLTPSLRLDYVDSSWRLT